MQPLRFVIHVGPYQNGSAGTRALHRLCHLLNERGERAFVSYPGNPEWREPLIRLNQIRPDDVVVYPEIVPGNPLAVKHVIRYVLNHPGMLGGDKVYHPDELVFYYHGLFRDSASLAAGRQLGQEHELFISVIEPYYFYNEERERDYDAYYSGKVVRPMKLYSYRNPNLMKPSTKLPEPIGPAMSPNAILIDKMWPETRKELGEFLRGCKTFYTFDHVTALIPEAQLCGVNAVLVDPEECWFERPEHIRYSPAPDVYQGRSAQALWDRPIDNFVELAYETFRG